MSQPFTLIAPTTAETAITGFIGAGERILRGKVWRASFNAGRPVEITRDGAAIAWEAAPRSIQQMACDTHAIFADLRNMAERAA